ncbi:MAG: AMP-binding protein, partial [Candidatus Sumerlaeota bacterium]|nr:AMP-binding protein [Candidatus Sumerlaeota bacterium]
MDLRHVFLHALEGWGEREVLIEGDRGIALRETAVGVVAMSDLLRAADRGETGHVGLFLPNSHAFVVSFYGALFAGKIPAPINPMTPAAELAYMIRVAGVKTLLTISPLRKNIEKLAAEGLGDVQAFYLDEMIGSLDAQAKAAMAQRCHPGRLKEMLAEAVPDVACLLFSSGTTGKPKAVMLTHSNLIENHRAVAKCFDFGPGDTVSGLLPMFHSFGLCVFYLAFITGARFVLAPRFTPTEFLKSMEKHEINLLLLVPQIYQVLAHTDGVRETGWSRIRLCLAGGAPIPPALREQWKAATGLTLYMGYGLTENSPVVSICVPDRQREGSAGRPLPGIEAKILDEKGRPLSANEEGEICVRGHSVMKGYYGNPAATREMIDPEGWMHTGDSGYLDADGYLYVCGRKKDIIIVAGENVHPVEIEDALTTHPDVAEAAVMGVADDVRGEAPKAFVV